MNLALNTLPKFEQYLTQMSDLDKMNELLSNLLMTNEQFISFLQEKVYDYIIAPVLCLNCAQRFDIWSNSVFDFYF